jgi:acyl-CoA synthetase (AMP-forming)/AMP-acid ligase II
MGSVTRKTRQLGNFVANEFGKGKGLIYHYFEEHALGANANNVFLIFEGRSWTYREFYDDVQLVGNWLMNDLGVKKDEMVALDGANSPQYVMILLALNGIGAASAYINSNLTAAALVHCVEISGAKHLLADRAVQTLVVPCKEALRKAGKMITFYDDGLAGSLHDSTALPTKRRAGLSPTGVARVIYTSGTTGLPKGVMLARARELVSAQSISDYLQLKPGVRMYTCLPLYHVSAHNLCKLRHLLIFNALLTLQRHNPEYFRWFNGCPRPKIQSQDILA